ncbi:putative cytochrome-c oxidase [Helianthus debilis subsp. tardiflorus]
MFREFIRTLTAIIAAFLALAGAAWSLNFFFIASFCLFNSIYWLFIYSNTLYLFIISDEQSLTFDSYTIPEDDLELGQLRLLEVDNRVVVPAKSHLRIIVTSADVLHSWVVPSSGVKCDAVPGHNMLQKKGWLKPRWETPDFLFIFLLGIFLPLPSLAFCSGNPKTPPIDTSGFFAEPPAPYAWQQNGQVGPVIAEPQQIPAAIDPEPLWADEVRRRALRTRLDLRNQLNIWPLSPQVMTQIIDYQILVEREIEKYLLAQGYHRANLVRNWLEIRQQIFSGERFTVRNYQRLWGTIQDFGIENSAPLQRVRRGNHLL